MSLGSQPEAISGEALASQHVNHMVERTCYKSLSSAAFAKDDIYCIEFAVGGWHTGGKFKYSSDYRLSLSIYTFFF